MCQGLFDPLPFGDILRHTIHSLWLAFAIIDGACIHFQPDHLSVYRVDDAVLQVAQIFLSFEGFRHHLLNGQGIFGRTQL